MLVCVYAAGFMMIPSYFPVCRLYRGDDLAFVIRLYDGRLGAERTDALRDIVNEVGICAVSVYFRLAYAEHIEIRTVL